MTILTSDVARNMKHVRAIMKDLENMSDLEAMLISQIAINVLMGMRTKEEILNHFEEAILKHPNMIDLYKILKEIIKEMNDEKTNLNIS
jgi:hypothetical protein